MSKAELEEKFGVLISERDENGSKIKRKCKNFQSFNQQISLNTSESVNICIVLSKQI